MKITAILILLLYSSCAIQKTSNEFREENQSIYFDQSLKKIQLLIKNNKFNTIEKYYTERKLLIDSEIELTDSISKIKYLKKYFQMHEADERSSYFIRKKILINRGGELLKYNYFIKNNHALIFDDRGYTEIQLCYSNSDKRWKLQSLNQYAILSEIQ